MAIPSQLLDFTFFIDFVMTLWCSLLWGLFPIDSICFLLLPQNPFLIWKLFCCKMVEETCPSTSLSQPSFSSDASQSQKPFPSVPSLQNKNWGKSLISYYPMDWWIDPYTSRDRNGHKLHLVVQSLVESWYESSLIL